MLTEYLVKGALLGAEWVLYLLLILSVISVAMMIDRVVLYFKIRRRLDALEDASLKADDAFPEGCEECIEGFLLKMVDELAEQTANGHDTDLVGAQMDNIISRYRRRLERFLPFLGTLGNNAPFIGLFGTVIGVIQAFFQLGANLDGGASAVMGGISEALVATAAGLAVAIPAVIAYNFFSGIVDTLIERFTLVAWTRLKLRRQ